MTTTNNITTSTAIINNYNNTEQTINPNQEQLDNNLKNAHIPTKVCNRCLQIKYITEFYKEKRTNDGYRNQCKNCRNNYKKEYSKK